jgi:phage replication-related protein YjqB (UPF0714/DUF867 family)
VSQTIGDPVNSKRIRQMIEFSNYRELSLNREEGRDFQIRKKQRGSPVAIIAPHGGTIEPVTSKLAVATASVSFSWYCFEGLRGNRGNLHITSAKFDEPQCLELIAASDIVMAMHGRKDDGDPTVVLVGGLHDDLRTVVSSELSRSGFPATTGSKKFPGRDPSNICNRGRTGAGIQLEMRRSLRDRLDKDEALFNRFVGVLSGTLGGYADLMRARE